jgi:phage shock protein C
MKRIYLSKTDRKIFGICGGISEVHDIDPTLVRLALVFICVATAVIPCLITYLAGYFIIPDKPQKQTDETKP